MRNLKRVNKKVTHWPNIKMVNCTFIGTDNTLYDAEILPEEVELLLILRKFKSNGSLKENELISLEKMIEDYGRAKWSEGCNDCEIETEDL